MDIATGTGHVMLEIASQFKEVVGVDRSEAMINGCKLKLDKHPNVRVEVCDFMEWKTEEKFDYITIGQALHWFEDPEAVLKKVHSLLAPEGMLVVYGYIPVDLRDGNSSKRKDYT